VAISILNWNGWRDTIECLECVRGLDYPNYLTIVVDNGSSDDSVPRIREWASGNLGHPHVLVDYTRSDALAGGCEGQEAVMELTAPESKLVLIRNEENLGFTGGNNVAIHYALQRKPSADYLFFLNNDAKVAPDCLTHLVRTDQNDNLGVVGATIFDEAGERVIAGPLTLPHFPLGRDPLARWAPPSSQSTSDFVESFAVHASAALMRSEALRAVRRSRGEYLEERLFMYYDELILAYAVRKAGFRCVVAMRARARHKNAQSSGGLCNPVLYYYTVRNRLLVAREILPNPWKLTFHLLHVPLALAQAAKNLLHGRSHSWWAIMCGLVDGYRGVGGKWKHHDQEALGRKDVPLSRGAFCP